MPGDNINIIIPLYNPHEGWENQFGDHLSELEQELKETEFTVILVNDGSTKALGSIEHLMNRFR